MKSTLLVMLFLIAASPLSVQNPDQDGQEPLMENPGGLEDDS